ncbi:hypothetical protein LTR10_001614 [Elasticomyces elasticus]|nr:hypothetical protein LTR10_001614 [Elasticomyces elasticus]KAK4975118.1 hypothetical protein LTR42_004328 [Elasticomyces elasticus]
MKTSKHYCCSVIFKQAFDIPNAAVARLVDIPDNTSSDLEGPEIVAADEAHNLKNSTSMYDSNDSWFCQNDLLDSFCVPEKVSSLIYEPLGELMRQVEIRDVESSEKLAAVRNELLEAWKGNIMQAFICCEGGLSLLMDSSETAQDS